MKKNKLWAKIKIQEELESWGGVEGGIDEDGINYILNIIDQLNETEVLTQEWVDNNVVHVRGLGDIIEAGAVENIIVPNQEITYEDAIKVIAENIDTDEFSVGLYIDALNNNEKYEFLTEKWIEGNKFEVNGWNEAVHVEDLENLIIPKQELPIVPTWFDEWWKDIPKGEGNLLHNIAQFHDKLYSYGTREVYDYINDTGNKKKLLNIIINELDYKVEEEQRYYVLFGSQSHDDNWTYALTNSGSIEIFEKDVLPEWDRTKLTEQEIKDYDPRYMVFAIPVEEGR